MPCLSYYLMIYTIILFISCIHFSIAGNNDTDRMALLEIKAKINSWNESLHFCTWYGVTCGLKHQRVTVTNLPSLKLSGSISPYIGNLRFLTVILGTLLQVRFLQIYQVVIALLICMLVLGNNKLIGRYQMLVIYV